MVSFSTNKECLISNGYTKLVAETDCNYLTNYKDSLDEKITCPFQHPKFLLADI